MSQPIETTANAASSTAPVEQPSQESIDPQLSPESSGELNAAPQDAPSEQEDTSIPEKFRGKSIQDIARSYSELEKKLGSIGSEKSHSEKQADELRAKLSQYEQERQELLSRAMVPQHQQQVVSQPEVDPLADIDQLLESDPKEAVKRVASYARSTNQNVSTRLQMEMRAREAQSYYEQQKAANSDFASLESDMQQLAMQYAPLLRPEVVNSKETINALYQMAKARNMNKYVADAVQKAKTSQETIKDEKRRAYSESSTSSTDKSGSVDFKDLDLKEMAALLGKVER